eukprot:GHVN01082535.1.p1 GENE.GHVN01082535.1~~GHVN01082535.1.p1  ORF type:complete len:742 (+),score=105.33 GHVN01082535.1:1675-3900(+)
MVASRTSLTHGRRYGDPGHQIHTAIHTSALTLNFISSFPRPLKLATLPTLLTLQFEEQLNRMDYVGYCDRRIGQAEEKHDEMMWKIIRQQFVDRANQTPTLTSRSEIIQTLGFDPSLIYQSIERHLGRPPGRLLDETTPSNTERGGLQVLGTCDGTTSGFLSKTTSMTEVDPELFFRRLGEDQVKQDMAAAASSLPREESNQAQDTEYKPPSADWNSGPERLMKQSLLVGDRAMAVEVALQCGRLADALLLAATSGDGVLWDRTRKEYTKLQRDPFLDQVRCIIDGSFDELVRSSDLTQWQETIAILATYSQEQFGELCEKVAKRLESEKFDTRAALICYVCAANFPNTVEIWSSMGSSQGSLQLGLQDLVEKMTVLKEAVGFNGHDEVLSKKVAQYAEILANSGRFTAAMRYLCLTQDDHSPKSAILRDRIYNSCPTSMFGVPPPPLPFQVEDIRPSPQLAPPQIETIPIAHGGYQASHHQPQLYQGPQHPQAPYNTYAGKYGQSISPPAQSSVHDRYGYTAPPPVPPSDNLGAYITAPPAGFMPPHSTAPAQYTNQPPLMMPPHSAPPIDPGVPYNAGVSAPPSRSPPYMTAAFGGEGIVTAWQSQQMGSSPPPPAQHYRSTGHVQQQDTAPKQPAYPVMSPTDFDYLHRVFDMSLQCQHEPNNKKMVDETRKKLDELYGKLRGGEVSQEIQAQLVSFGQAIEARDSGTAQKIQHDILSSSEFGQHKSWMMVLKRLTAK